MSYIYGWSPKQIREEVYPDDVVVYLKVGRKNKLEDNVMNLMIVQNPHVKDPKQLFEEMRAILRTVSGTEDDFDREGLQRLKQKMYKDSLMRKK